MKYINQLAKFGATDTELPATLDTEAAAAALNRKPQTLRKWACLGEGALSPIRINGRLHWKVSDIQNLLNGNSNNNAV